MTECMLGCADGLAGQRIKKEAPWWIPYRPKVTQCIISGLDGCCDAVQEMLERRYAKAGMSDRSLSGSGAAVRRGTVSPTSPGGHLARSKSENLEGERVRCGARSACLEPHSRALPSTPYHSVYPHLERVQQYLHLDADQLRATLGVLRGILGGTPGACMDMVR